MTNDENGKEEARREYFDGLDFGSDFGPQNRTFDRINLNNGDEIVVLTTIFPQIQGPFSVFSKPEGNVHYTYGKTHHKVLLL